MTVTLEVITEADLREYALGTASAEQRSRIERAMSEDAKVAEMLKRFTHGSTIRRSGDRGLSTRPEFPKEPDAFKRSH